MNIKHAPDTSQSAPSQAARAFLVTGLGSGLFRVIVAAAALLELFSFGVAFVGPYPAAAARIRHATDSIGLPDAWGFIAVMAALTIAAQVSASGNQYRNDFVARKRAPRFTSLAATTGGVALVGWVIFFARFRVAEPGPLALITIATGGIVFFAADAATVLLRSDMRNLLQRQRWSRLRRNVRVVRHELKAARSNACGTLVLCAISLLAWCGIVGAALVSFYFGVNTLLGADEYEVGVYGRIWMESSAMVVTFMSLTLPLTGLVGVLIVRKRFRMRKLLTAGAVAYTAVLLSLPVSLVAQGATSHESGQRIVNIGFSSALAAVMILAISPLMWRSVPSRKWWTPRGAVRLGYAAAVVAAVKADDRRIEQLNDAFGSSTLVMPAPGCARNEYSEALR